MHILELPKLPAEQKDETDLMQWMRFLGGKSREEFIKMAEKDSQFEEAYRVLDRLSADEEKRIEYEARQKAIRDRDILLKTGENRGLEKGREEGRIEGRVVERQENIREMLLDHVPIDKIKQYTKATDEEIKKIQQEQSCHS